MPRTDTCRRVAVFVLCLSLTASFAGASPAREPGPQDSVFFQDVTAQLWSFLTHLWDKTGGSLDPFGNPGPGDESDTGGSLDPFGPPGEENDGDTGGSLDPFGGK